MPIYEYLCRDCRKIVSIFFRSFKSQETPACPRCQGTNLERRISRVIIAKGDRRYFDELDRGQLLSHYEGRDKKSQEAWARRVASELGEAGSEFREMADKLASGQDVFDLYDPAPTLDYKLQEKKEKLTGGSGSVEGESSASGPDF